MVEKYLLLVDEMWPYILAVGALAGALLFCSIGLEDSMAKEKAPVAVEKPELAAPPSAADFEKALDRIDRLEKAVERFVGKL